MKSGMMIYRLIAGVVLNLLGALFLLMGERTISHFCFFGGIISIAYFFVLFFLRRRINR